MIFTVQPETLDALWPHAAPHLDRFSKDTLLLNAAELYESVKSAKSQMWLYESGGDVSLVVVTEVRDSEKGPVCTLKIASGNAGVQAVAEIVAEVEKWAESIGCVGMEIIGRKGWLKVLDGFRQTWVVLEKDIVRAN